MMDGIIVLLEFYRNICKSNYEGGNNYENDCTEVFNTLISQYQPQ